MKRGHRFKGREGVHKWAQRVKCFIQPCSLKCQGLQARQWPPKWLQWQQKLAFWFTTCRHRVRHSKAAKGAQRTEIKKNNKIDKRVKARVETGLVRMGQRTRGQKKKNRLNHHAQIERESVSFKSSGQANKAFIRRRPELDRQMLLML